MDEKIVNQVIVNSNVLMESIKATVTTDTLAVGRTALDKTGSLIEGTMVAGEGTVTDLTAKEPLKIDNNVISVDTIDLEDASKLNTLTDEELKYLVTAKALKNTVGVINNTLSQI